MDSSPYLRPAEVAARLGVSVWTIHHRIDAGDLPTLWVTGTTRRIEGRAVGADLPEPAPAGPMTLAGLARWLRVAPNTIRVAIAEERLRPRRAGPRGLSFPASEIARFVNDFTTGDE